MTIIQLVEGAFDFGFGSISTVGKPEPERPSCPETGHLTAVAGQVATGLSRLVTGSILRVVEPTRGLPVSRPER